VNVARALLPALTLLALTGCVVLRSTYDEEVIRRQNSEAELAAERARTAELSEKLERRELERASLGKERLDLIDELEDLRQENADLHTRLEETERRQQGTEAAVGEIQAGYKSLVEQLEEEVSRGQIEIQQLRGRLQIRALERILFDSGRAEIKPEGRTVLTKVAAQLKKDRRHQIRVEGHTDNIPISTLQFPSNWELSCARAARVLRFLVEQGLPPERLSAVGLGAYRPIEDNGTREGRARNRRIEIVLVPESEE
jgi:chemotaxis protein MotB